MITFTMEKIELDRVVKAYKVAPVITSSHLFLKLIGFEWMLQLKVGAIKGKVLQWHMKTKCLKFSTAFLIYLCTKLALADIL
jgi:hypothetical protein